MARCGAYYAPRRRDAAVASFVPRGSEPLLLIGKLFTDEHLTEMITHPRISLGVDGFTSAVDSPLAQVTAHPVCFAGHVHYLTRHVGELKSLSLEEAIRKMTSMPAEHFRLRDRGRLEAGRAADVVVLDLDQLADGSTLHDPVNYVRGVDHVVVNGAAVVADGQHNGRSAREASAAPLVGARIRVAATSSSVDTRRECD